MPLMSRASSRNVSGGTRTIGMVQQFQRAFWIVKCRNCEMSKTRFMKCQISPLHTCFLVHQELSCTSEAVTQQQTSKTCLQLVHPVLGWHDVHVPVESSCPGWKRVFKWRRVSQDFRFFNFWLAFAVENGETTNNKATMLQQAWRPWPLLSVCHCAIVVVIFVPLWWQQSAHCVSELRLFYS